MGIGDLVNKAKHDRAVLRIAEEYEKRGCKVYADIKGYPKPPIIGGYEPDVVADKKGHRTIVALETRDSISTLQTVFKDAEFTRMSKRSSVTHYKRLLYGD